MKYARLFRENEPLYLVSAEDVKNGLYSRDEEFVDPEYEFKVQFVKGAKNNGGPYFRLYYSYEEYKKLFPDRASRYEIVCNMRRFQETHWHKKWKAYMADFCDIEKYVKSPQSNKYKYADAFYKETNTCIEFQHSYIALDFEERNEFYAALGINTIWLYDLSEANIRKNRLGNVEILENNAKGFFRISENPDNLQKQCVYIQVKSGTIYRVKQLDRCSSSTEYQSTIRYFVPTEEYSEEEFMDAIKNNRIKKDEIPQPLQHLWKSRYKWMVVRKVKGSTKIRVNHNGRGEMYRDFKTGHLKVSIVELSGRDVEVFPKEENEAVWVLEESCDL